MDDERLVLALVAALFFLLLCQLDALGGAAWVHADVRMEHLEDGFGHVEVDQRLEVLVVDEIVNEVEMELFPLLVLLLIGHGLHPVVEVAQQVEPKSPRLGVEVVLLLLLLYENIADLGGVLYLTEVALKVHDGGVEHLPCVLGKAPAVRRAEERERELRGQTEGVTVSANILAAPDTVLHPFAPVRILDRGCPLRRPGSIRVCVLVLAFPRHRIVVLCGTDAFKKK